MHVLCESLLCVHERSVVLPHVEHECGILAASEFRVLKAVVGGAHRDVAVVRLQIQGRVPVMHMRAQLRVPAHHRFIVEVAVQTHRGVVLSHEADHSLERVRHHEVVRIEEAHIHDLAT